MYDDNYEFVDIHTHKTYDSENVFSIYNLCDEAVDEVGETTKFSVGIHPWFIDQYSTVDIVHEKSSDLNCYAIGEIGLDKRCTTDFESQKKYFINQLLIAKEKNLPVIIHCVKAYNEVFSILKSVQFSHPVLLHSFAGSIEVAEMYIKHFNVFFSFGSLLYKNKSKAYSSFSSLPLSHIFLETDSSDLLIEDIYTLAASIRNVELGMLKKEILQNLSHFLSPSKPI